MTHTPGDGNRIIAEFMGQEKCTMCNPPHCGKYRFGQSIYFLPSDMQYHTSWEWLMPVVEKIETMGWCHVIAKLISDEQRSHFINYHTGEEICGSRTDSKLTAIYSSVIEFINWYNTNRFQTNDR